MGLTGNPPCVVKKNLIGNHKKRGCQLKLSQIWAQILLFDWLQAWCEPLLFNWSNFGVPPLMRIPLNLNKGQISNRANNAKLKRFQRVVVFREKYFIEQIGIRWGCYESSGFHLGLPSCILSCQGLKITIHVTKKQKLNKYKKGAIFWIQNCSIDAKVYLILTI